MSLISKCKEVYNNYIKRLEKINKEEFDEGELDCCELNKNE